MRDRVRSLQASEPQLSSIFSLGTELKTMAVINLEKVVNNNNGYQNENSFFIAMAVVSPKSFVNSL